MLFITPLTLNQNNVETAELFVYDFLMNIVLGGGGGMGWARGGLLSLFSGYKYDPNVRAKEIELEFLHDKGFKIVNL